MLQRFKQLGLELANSLAQPFYPKRYCLKPGYTPNYFAAMYKDTEDFAQRYQTAVYKQASALIQNNQLSSVVDIGCGYGLKLKEFILPHSKDITGIDLAHAIDYCQSHHDFGTWIKEDITKPHHSFDPEIDLIICSDVIEHLKNPDHLLDYLKFIGSTKTIILLSTPERDKVRGNEDLGPPSNPAHVREWNQTELREYVTQAGFEIHEHRLVQDLEDEYQDFANRKYGFTCQLMILGLTP